MAGTYNSLPQLARVELPGSPGVTYALIDQDGREMIATKFSEAASYLAGDYVIYGTNDALYRFVQNKEAGSWSAIAVEEVKIGDELKRLAGLIAGGIHYRGKTLTPLYEGATTNPINIINIGSYTAESGDLVILTLDITHFSAYAANQAIAAHTYFYNGSSPVTYYYTTAAITAEENTSLAAIGNKVNIVSQNLEFLFDGASWSALGLVDNGLGDLAYKDNASGTYVKPTGSGTVSGLNASQISASKKAMATSTLYPVGANTTTASKATAGTAVSVATVGSAVVYGTADVGAAVTYGTADADTAVANVAISDNTGGAATHSFTIEGVTVSVAAGTDKLVFSTANTDSVRGVTSSQSITPAKASTKTLTPAAAAPASQTIIPAVANGTITPYTFADVTVPIKADQITYATGSLTDGTQLVTAVTATNTTLSVNVDTTTDTVTVK